MDLSIVVPVFNSADTLPRLVEELDKALGAMGRPYQLVFVDDGSRDSSWPVLQSLHQERPQRMTNLRLMRNFGQHNALMCGFRHATGAYVVTLDDDLQNPPEEIATLLEAIETDDMDVVYGVSRKRQHDRWRNLGSNLIMFFFQKVFRTGVRTSSFRIIRRELVQCILDYSLNYTYIDGLLAWSTDRLGVVEVDHHTRASGRSGYSLAKLLLLALNLFTNFSILPLQVVSFVGLASFLGALGLALYYLQQYLVSAIPVPGYASIIIAVLSIGGAQMLSLGIMGEYLGRLHLNVNHKPQYVVRDALYEGALDDDEESP